MPACFEALNHHEICRIVRRRTVLNRESCNLHCCGDSLVGASDPLRSRCCRSSRPRRGIGSLCSLHRPCDAHGMCSSRSGFIRFITTAIQITPQSAACSSRGVVHYRMPSDAVQTMLTREQGQSAAASCRGGGPVRSRQACRCTRLLTWNDTQTFAFDSDMPALSDLPPLECVSANRGSMRLRSSVSCRVARYRRGRTPSVDHRLPVAARRRG